MHIISTLSLWAGAVIGILAALGKIHYPLTWGTTSFDGAVALVGVICLAHAVARLRRRGSMGTIRFGQSH